MTNKTKYLLIGVPLGIVAFGYMSYRYVLANYSFSFAGASINNLDWNNNVLDLELMFDLKSSIGIGFVVKDIELDVFLQGTKVGHISKSDSILVPSNGNTKVSIPLTVDLSVIKNNALGLLTSALKGVEVMVDGYSKAYISGIPLGINVSVQEKFNF
jgi:hypothetical protein